MVHICMQLIYIFFLLISRFMCTQRIGEDTSRLIHRRSTKWWWECTTCPSKDRFVVDLFLLLREILEYI